MLDWYGSTRAVRLDSVSLRKHDDLTSVIVRPRRPRATPVRVLMVPPLWLNVICAFLRTENPARLPWETDPAYGRGRLNPAALDKTDRRVFGGHEAPVVHLVQMSVLVPLVVPA